MRLAALLALALGLSSVARADPEELRPAPRVPVQVAPPAAAQVTAGDALLAEGRYREAAAQYEAAYSIDPSVEILERLADAYQLAGDVERARLLRRRVLQARSPSQEYWVTPVPAPVRPVPLQPRRVRVGSTLLRMGLGMFAGGYTSAVLSGGIGVYVTEDGDDYRDASKMLFIPIVGPFVSFHFVQDGLWLLPVAINGALQLAGVSLAIAGGALLGAHRTTTLTLAPFSTGAAHGLSFGGDF